MLPFSHAEFLDVFARYNLAIWPAQLVAYVLGAALLAGLLPGRTTRAARLVPAGLALMWAWTGVAYHWMFFAGINKAAWAFGGLFVLQAALLAFAAGHQRLRFEASVATPARWLGWFLMLYALVLYPLLGLATGSGYTQLPIFGVTPCPVTIFTFGLLLLSSAPVPWWLLVIPVAWSLVGGSAAFLLQIPQDWLLLLSAGSLVFMMRRPAGRPEGGPAGRTVRLEYDTVQRPMEPRQGG